MSLAWALTAVLTLLILRRPLETATCDRHAIATPAHRGIRYKVNLERNSHCGLIHSLRKSLAPSSRVAKVQNVVIFGKHILSHEGGVKTSEVERVEA